MEEPQAWRWFTTTNYLLSALVSDVATVTAVWSPPTLRLANDGFPNEDKLGLHLENLIRDRIGEVFLPYVHPHCEDQEGGRVLVVRCEAGPKAAFVKDGQLQRFYVRAGPSTAELSGGSILDYQKSRFS